MQEATTKLARMEALKKLIPAVEQSIRGWFIAMTVLKCVGSVFSSAAMYIPPTLEEQKLASQHKQYQTELSLLVASVATV